MSVVHCGVAFEHASQSGQILLLCQLGPCEAFDVVICVLDQVRAEAFDGDCISGLGV